MKTSMLEISLEDPELRRYIEWQALCLTKFLMLKSLKNEFNKQNKFWNG